MGAPGHQQGYSKYPSTRLRRHINGEMLGRSELHSVANMDLKNRHASKVCRMQYLCTSKHRTWPIACACHHVIAESILQYAAVQKPTASLHQRMLPLLPVMPAIRCTHQCKRVSMWIRQHKLNREAKTMSRSTTIGLNNTGIRMILTPTR